MRTFSLTNFTAALAVSAAGVLGAQGQTAPAATPAMPTPPATPAQAAAGQSPQTGAGSKAPGTPLQTTPAQPGSMQQPGQPQQPSQPQQPGTMPQAGSTKGPLASGAVVAGVPMPGMAITTAAGEVITLDDAIKRAQGADTAYASAVADRKVAKSQVGIARSALLPGVVYHNQFLYTQPADASSPRFIANNAVHEYTSQGIVTETLSASLYTDLARTHAEASASKARLEVARRGLVSTVVGAYYAILVSDRKLEIAERALDEATAFGKLSGQLETGGEVAHLDVVKAQLQVQQQQRAVSDALLQAQTSRLDLGVLLFSNPATAFSIAGTLEQIPQLPTRADFATAANNGNPDVKAAMLSFQAAQLELRSAKFDYLPALTTSFIYGLDSSQFAFNLPDGTRNVGYSAYATLDIPVFDWFATRNRVRQSGARRDLAQVELNSTQRRLLASIETLYRESEVSREQIASLDRSVLDATDALRLTRLRYTSGEAPILEVIDAQNTLITAQNGRADAAARFSTALANLQTLTGIQP